MNILNFLKNKLTSKPPSLTTGEVKQVATDKQSIEFLKKFGIVQSELHKSVADTGIINWERQGVYQIVDRSMAHPLMAGAVGLYADYASTPSQLQNSTVWCTTESREYRYQIEKLFDVINLEEVIYDWLWTLSAFGDIFVQVHGQPGVGIVSISDDQHPINVSRVDYNGRLVGFYETPLGYSSPDERKLLPPWEYVHGRLLGAKKRRSQHMDSQFTEFRTISIMTPDDRRLTSKYGTSILADAFPTWKRLRLAEDSVLMARINRGVMRYVWKVAVGENQNPEAVANLVDNYVDELKRARALDLGTNNTNGNYQDRFNAMACLVGETKINLLDGTQPTIQQMAENPNQYLGKYVQSVNPETLKLEPKPIVGIQKTRLDAELIRVHLDNEEHVDCTPDHRFMTRSGVFVEAQNLKQGDSLMPYYSQITKEGYRRVFDPHHNKFIPEHRLVMSRLGLHKKGNHTHHKDLKDPNNKLNNDPSNLQSVTRQEHMEIHGGFKRGKNFDEIYGEDKALVVKERLSEGHLGITYPNRKKPTLTQEHIKKMVLGRSGKKQVECKYCGKQWVSTGGGRAGHEGMCSKNPSYAERCNTLSTLAKLDWATHKAVALNHKVISVERLTERQDTYDLQIADNHNFPLSAGIFVHNSMEDIIVPVWGNTDGLKFDKMGGEVDIKWIADIEELRNQLATALRVPLGLLSGYSKEGVQSSIGSSSIERMDIRFARQARRVQRSLINMLTRLVQIHLAYQGMDTDLNLFKIQMTETSTAEEEELKSALDKGVDVVGKLSELVINLLGDVDTDKKELLNYLNKKFLKLNDMDIEKMLLKGNPNAFKEHDRTQPVPGVETPGGEKKAEAEAQLKQPNPFRESNSLSDLKSALPINEQKVTDWKSGWGDKTVKITPINEATKP